MVKTTKMIRLVFRVRSQKSTASLMILLGDGRVDSGKLRALSNNYKSWNITKDLPDVFFLPLKQLKIWIKKKSTELEQ